MLRCRIYCCWLFFIFIVTRSTDIYLSISIYTYKRKRPVGLKLKKKTFKYHCHQVCVYTYACSKAVGLGSFRLFLQPGKFNWICAWVCLTEYIYQWQRQRGFSNPETTKKQSTKYWKKNAEKLNHMKKATQGTKHTTFKRQRDTPKQRLLWQLERYQHSLVVFFLILVRLVLVRFAQRADTFDNVCKVSVCVCMWISVISDAVSSIFIQTVLLLARLIFNICMENKNSRLYMFVCLCIWVESMIAMRINCFHTGLVFNYIFYNFFYSANYLKVINSFFMLIYIFYRTNWYIELIWFVF